MSASLLCTTRSARSKDLCRVLYSHAVGVSRAVYPLISPISLFTLHRRSRIWPAGFAVGRLSEQLHGWEVGFDCGCRIRFTVHALPRGRDVSEFLEAGSRARNRTISDIPALERAACRKKWITNHDAKTDSPSPKEASENERHMANVKSKDTTRLHFISCLQIQMTLSALINNFTHTRQQCMPYNTTCQTPRLTHRHTHMRPTESLDPSFLSTCIFTCMPPRTDMPSLSITPSQPTPTASRPLAKAQH
jgi:hypothetical protein